MAALFPAVRRSDAYTNFGDTILVYGFVDHKFLWLLV